LETSAIGSTDSGVPAKPGTASVTNSAHAAIWPRQKTPARSWRARVRPRDEGAREQDADRGSRDEGRSERRHLLEVFGDERGVDARAEGDREGEEARALAHEDLSSFADEGAPTRMVGPGH
jgi:hypothetical protein